MQRFQDKLGVDDRTALATLAAAQLASGQKYNRSDLIPEVTQFLQPTLTWMLEESGKADFCETFGDPMVKQGVLQKVHQ